MKIVVTEMPKTSQECLFSQVLSNGIFTCILDNGNYCGFICEETTQCPCLITYDKLNDKNNNPINKEYMPKKDEEGNYICLKDDSFVCPDGEEYGTCSGCPLGEAVDNRLPEDDC